MIHPLLDNLEAQLLYREALKPGASDYAPNSILKTLNEKLISELESELFPHGKILTSPVQEIDGNRIFSVTRKLSTEYNLEIAQDAKIRGRQDGLLDIWSKEIASELRLIRDEDPNSDFIPFVLVDSSGIVISPKTFQPLIGFVTRFARLRNDHPVNRNMKHYLGESETDIPQRVAIEIATRFMDRYAGKVFPHGLTLDGPIKEAYGYKIEAKSKSLKTKFVFPESVSSSWTISEITSVIEMKIDDVVDRIYEEFNEELTKIEPDSMIIPHILLYPVIFMSVDSGGPQIAFKTRYAVVPEDDFLQAVWGLLTDKPEE
jgi:hypothetical protein